MVITGSQKALMLPPGLAFISVSEKARRRKPRTVKQPNLYLDLNSYLKSLQRKRRPPGPPPSPSSAVGRRPQHDPNRTPSKASGSALPVFAAATRAAVKALNLGVFSKSPSDSVTGINYPEGFTDKEFRGALRKQLNMNVANGQGSMEGNIFRVNHMGYVDQTDTLGVVAGIEIILRQQGYKNFDFGAGVAAAHKELSPNSRTNNAI